MRFGKWMLAAAMTAAAMPASAAPVSPNSNANGEALILIPLTLTKIADLSFGTVVTSASSGMVAIDAATGARTVAGGVTGVASDAGNRAYFAGAGSPNQQVIMTMVPPANLTSAAGDTIPVMTLTLDNGNNPIRTVHPVNRTFFVGVGGILMIGANQPEGLYEATFTVTANYQ